MSAYHGTGTAEAQNEARNEQLAELVARDRETILHDWVQDLRRQQRERYASVSDECLYEQFGPTVDCMTYLLHTGDISGTDKYLRNLISQRMEEGYLLADIEKSILVLQHVVLKRIESQIQNPQDRSRAYHAICELHDLTALRVADVYQELEQEDRRRFLEAYELGTVLSRSLDLETILDTGVRKLAEDMHATSAAIVLAGTDYQPARAASLVKTDPEVAKVLPQICHALGCGPDSVEIMEARVAACVVPDVSKAESLSQWHELLENAEIRSLACVPLITAKRVLGTAVVAMAEKYEFSRSEVDYLLALVGHIAMAAQNAQLYDEARGKREVDLLLSAARLFTSSLDTQEVLRQTAGRSAESVGADYSFVLLPDETGEKLHVAAYSVASGKPQDLVKRIMSHVEPAGIEVGSGANGKAFKTGEPILIEDYDAYTDQIPQFTGVTGSMLVVPMKLRGKSLGVFTLVSFRPEAFRQSDVSLASGIADQAAIAVENAKLYETARRAADETHMLYNVATLASSSLDLSEVLDIMVHEISKLAGVARTGLYLVDPTSRTIKLCAQVGFDEDECRNVDREPMSLDLLTPAGVEALRRGEPIFIPNPKLHIEMLSRLLARYGSVCALVVPLLTRGKLIGMAVMDDKGKYHTFSESSIRLLSSMAGTVATSIENARLMQHEKHIAETLQKSFLPATLPSVQGFELAAKYRSALEEAEVGGDFYDMFGVNDKKIAFLIADVAGKGMSAAIYTAAGKYMLRAYAFDDPSPGKVMCRLNEALCRYLPVGMFITLFYGMLDPASHKFVYANGGHDEPMLYSMSDDKITKLEVTGPAAGNIENAGYGQIEVAMNPGDTLLLYTDGATDVRREGILLEPTGLERVFRAHAKEPAAEVVEHVFQDVMEYSHGRLTDDIALMVLKRATGS